MTIQFYREESSNPKWDAQRNLSGRTHYVDDDTLRYHKARVLATYVTDRGLLYALIESYAVDMHNTKRAFRPVVFDTTGYVLHRPDLEAGFKTRKQAEAAMWAVLNGLDAVKVTQDAIDRTEGNYAREIQYMRENLLKLVSKAE